MIVGTVHNWEAEVRLRVRGESETIEVTAIVDTGFTGDLTLPTNLVNDLHLEFEAEVEAVLADGTIVRTDAYAGSVEWNGVHRNIMVLAGEGDILLGMMLMSGHNLLVEIIEGGTVQIAERG